MEQEFKIGDWRYLTQYNFIKLEKPQLKFSFNLKSDSGEVNAEELLTPEEFEVFENVFTRIANNATRIL